MNEKLYRPRHIWNDYRPCLDRVSSDYRPSLDRLSTNYRPLYRLSVDRLSTDYLPLYRPSVDRLSTECRPSVDRLSTECQQSVDRLSTAISTDRSVDTIYSKHDDKPAVIHSSCLFGAESYSGQRERKSVWQGFQYKSKIFELVSGKLSKCLYIHS